MGILARILGVVVLAVTLGSGRSAALADDAAPRPNIIFVMLDDLDVPVTQPYYGEILPETMKLANTGVDFANAFATTPVCCPSRAAFLSGKHGHNTNVLTNGGPRGGRWQFIDDEPESLPALMYFHGYRTAIFGKYMNGFHKHGRRVPDLPYGWTDGSLFANANLKPYKGYNYHLARWRGGRPVDATTWQADDVRLVRYGDKDQDYSTDVVFDQVFEFIEQAVRDTPGQPFFTMIQPTCPHFPLPPAPRHRAIATEKWGFDTFPKDRPNYFRSDEGDGAPDDKPLHLQHTWKKRMRMKDRGGKFLKWTGAELPLDVKKAKVGWNELDWYNRMGSMYACDEGIAEMVRRLQALGVWENTFVIVTSDNGYNFGAHALGLKMAPYDEAARIPFWVFGGEQLGLSGGIIEEAPILNIDLAPTVLEAAGAEVPQDMDGRSLMPFLRGANETPVPWREAVYFEYYGPGVAEGHFAKFYRLHFEWMPPMFLDLPSYKAIRVRVPWEVEGEVVDREFLYVEWDRYPEMRRLKRKLRNERKGLQRRIGKGSPRLVERVERAIAKDVELYDVADDPYQLFNLVHRQPGVYAHLAAQLSSQLARVASCAGQGGKDGCP